MRRNKLARGIEKLLIENSHILFPVFVAVVVGIFCDFYISQIRINSSAAALAKSRELYDSTLELAGESYRAQLQLWEYGWAPNDERLQSFERAKMDFLQQFTIVHDLLEHPTERSTVADRGLAEVDAVFHAIPRIEDHWNLILDAASRAHGDPRLLRERMLEAESYFDTIQLDKVLERLVAIQENDDKITQDLIERAVKRRNALLFTGLFLVLLIGGMAMVLQRRAIEGKSHQLQLVQASKLASLGTLGAGLAHELNNPLMFVLGFNGRVASVLRKKEFDPQSPVWDYLKEVEDGVKRMQKIVEYFRDFSRASSHEMHEVSINQVIERSFTLISEQLRIRDISIRRELCNLDPHVMGDENRLEQVCLNLITNSRDALEMGCSQERPKIISVRTWVDVASAQVVFEVEDNGCGISKRGLERIFDPFFTTKPVGKGTGLGLSVSRGIVQEHLGKISVKSEQGKGTTFSISLPLAASVGKRIEAA